MQKSFLTPLGFVRQYNSSKPYCSPSVIIQGNFHLSKHPNERFDRFFVKKIIFLHFVQHGFKKLQAFLLEIKYMNSFLCLFCSQGKVKGLHDIIVTGVSSIAQNKDISSIDVTHSVLIRTQS